MDDFHSVVVFSPKTIDTFSVTMCYVICFICLVLYHMTILSGELYFSQKHLKSMNQIIKQINPRQVQVITAQHLT